MPVFAKEGARAKLGQPDMEAIARESTDENSRYFYPRLLKAFMANDTLMTPEEFQYFYYGTMFQEDYDPYRAAPNKALFDELHPIYAKEKRTRADRAKMLAYATQVLDDNPVDLRQLTNKIYVYEQNGKHDLARIWQYKLNHLLLVSQCEIHKNIPFSHCKSAAANRVANPEIIVKQMSLFPRRQVLCLFVTTKLPGLSTIV